MNATQKLAHSTVQKQGYKINDTPPVNGISIEEFAHIAIP